MKPIAYLDTNILKFSATSQLRLLPRMQMLHWGNIKQEVIVHDILYSNPNDNIKNNPSLKTEADLLKYVAILAKNQKIRFVINIETIIESWGLPHMDSTTGKFYGAPYDIVKAPIKCNRVISGAGFRSIKDEQYEFLSSINHERFNKIKKMAGAYQGKHKLNRNQLLDAFHIWCAEHNKCSHFLTLDLKLINLMKSHAADINLSFVTPSEMIKILIHQLI
jgi:hypothetical protein